jgi:hypothetical protein
MWLIAATDPFDLRVQFTPCRCLIYDQFCVYRVHSSNTYGLCSLWPIMQQQTQLQTSSGRHSSRDTSNTRMASSWRTPVDEADQMKKIQSAHSTAQPMGDWNLPDAAEFLGLNGQVRCLSGQKSFLVFCAVRLLCCAISSGWLGWAALSLWPVGGCQLLWSFKNSATVV